MSAQTSICMPAPAAIAASSWRGTPSRARRSGRFTRSCRSGAARWSRQATSRSTAPWIGCSRPWMPRTGMSSGNSAPAPDSLASRSPIAAPTDSNTSRSCRASAAGRVWWQTPRSIRGCATARSVLSVRPRICRSTPRAGVSCWSSNSAARMVRTPAMRLRNSYPGIALGFLVGLATTAAAASDRELRVCADPNNLPFSNSAEAGFENRLAAMVAEHFGLQVSYTWWAQRRGFIRNTLKAGKCDVVMGVPSGYDLVETTRPYYRSSYVFVTRQDQHLELSSLLDPRLHHLVIGVHLIGDDGNNPPPAQALGDQGIVDNVRGYSIYGDYRQADPPARLIEAVESGSLDVAAAWGPLGGYFAQRSPVPLTVTPIRDYERFAPQQFQFAIAMGVREGDDALRDRLNEFIDEHRSEITSLLRSYGVPLVDQPVTVSGGHE